MMKFVANIEWSDDDTKVFPQLKGQTITPIKIETDDIEVEEDIIRVIVDEVYWIYDIVIQHLDKSRIKNFDEIVDYVNNYKGE